MKLGAEPKKLAILGGLLAVALVVFLMNSGGSGGEAPVSPPAGSRTVPLPAASPGAPRNAAATSQARGRTAQKFPPPLKPKRAEDRPDPMSIDPTLRLNLLTRLQNVNVEGVHRSIFDFGQQPAPKPDPAKLAAAKPVPSPIVPAAGDAPAAAAAPATPHAPPIPLKFYGYVSRSGLPQKRAFFMEGEDIHVVAEGDTLKARYRIVRIGINSVVVEDMQFKSQQTLPLEEQQG